MPRSPEDFYLDSIDRQGNPFEGVHYVANEKFNKRVASSWNRIRPRATQFPYHNKADDELVKRIEQGKHFVQERSDPAVGLEYVVMEGIHNNKWMGQEASVTPTAKFDDMVNHVDAVVTFQPGDEPMHLALDVTSGSDYALIEKKINQTVENLEQGKLTEVKYFIDDETGVKQPILAPRVVVAVTPKETAALVDNMVESPKTIPNNPIQLLILDEAIEQLSFGLETLKNHQATAEVQEKYQRLINYLTAIRQEKNPSVTQGANGQVMMETISQIINQHRQILS